VANRKTSLEICLAPLTFSWQLSLTFYSCKLCLNEFTQFLLFLLCSLRGTALTFGTFYFYFCSTFFGIWPRGVKSLLSDFLSGDDDNDNDDDINDDDDERFIR